jgi:hypothetical protein
MAKEYCTGMVALIFPIALIALSHQMNATLITKKNGIDGKMKRTRINQYSLKKITELNAEAPVRVALCQRANGRCVQRIVTVYHNGDKSSFTKVECFNGICEECHKPANKLTPHEKVFRSHMGKLSLDNTLSVCIPCHKKLQRSEPRWRR